MVLTNGSAYPAAVQAPRLRAVGLPIEDSQMLTPSSVTAGVLAASRREARAGAGIARRGPCAGARPASRSRFTGEPDCERVDAVYVGWHPDCGMKDIEAACNAIWAGAKLYVASDVPFFASKTGRTIGYSYAITAAMRRMTKAPAIITGKPSLHALSFVARQLGVRKTRSGRGGRRSAGRDDHGASGRRHGLWRLHGHHQPRAVG